MEHREWKLHTSQNQTIPKEKIRKWKDCEKETYTRTKLSILGLMH